MMYTLPAGTGYYDTKTYQLGLFFRRCTGPLRGLTIVREFPRTKGCNVELTTPNGGQICVDRALLIEEK